MKNRIHVATILLLMVGLGWLLRNPVPITCLGASQLWNVYQQANLSPDLLYTIHRVKVGESPYGISRRYGMSVPELSRLNDLTKQSVIHPGDLLKVHYYRHLIPQARNGAGQEATALLVLSLVISEYDNDTLTVAKGSSGKSPDFSFFHGYAPSGVPRFQAYREGRLTKQHIMDLLEAAVKATKKGDLLVVQLAGHGEIIGNQWYLLPADFRAPHYDRLISGRGLLTILSRAKGSVLLILDSCHSGEISREKDQLPLMKPDFGVITSCLPKQKAEIMADGNGRPYGLFTLSWETVCQEKTYPPQATFNLLDLMLRSQYQVDNRGTLHAQNPVIAISPRVPIPYWN